MIDRLTAALARSRADYTEIRVERTWSTAVTFRGRRLESATASEDQGGFVRALHAGGGWGVASFTSLDRLEAMVTRAAGKSCARTDAAAANTATRPRNRRDSNFMRHHPGREIGAYFVQKTPPLTISRPGSHVPVVGRPPAISARVARVDPYGVALPAGDEVHARDVITP